MARLGGRRHAPAMESTQATTSSRQEAIRRLQHRRMYRRQLSRYVAVNTGLVLIWLLDGGGSFWPIWPIACWGLALLIQGWKLAHPEHPFSEEEIERELQRGAPAPRA